MTATLDEPFVVFLIGARINRFWKFGSWLPVVRSMGQMLTELHAHPELGFLGGESWLGRSPLVVQYWRSLDHLLAYASARDAAHLPMWKRFNQRIQGSGDVGIWHETYVVSPGSYETIYNNMPPFGLGRVGQLRAIGRRADSARARLAGERDDR